MTEGTGPEVRAAAGQGLSSGGSQRFPGAQPQENGALPPGNTGVTRGTRGRNGTTRGRSCPYCHIPGRMSIGGYGGGTGRDSQHNDNQHSNDDQCADDSRRIDGHGSTDRADRTGGNTNEHLAERLRPVAPECVPTTWYLDRVRRKRRRVDHGHLPSNRPMTLDELRKAGVARARLRKYFRRVERGGAYMCTSIHCCRRRRRPAGAGSVAFRRRTWSERIRSCIRAASSPVSGQAPCTGCGTSSRRNAWSSSSPTGRTLTHHLRISG